jgi:beta-glucosidase
VTALPAAGEEPAASDPSAEPADPDPFAESAAQARLAEGFPADFAWGAATAAYQIEGSVSHDGRGQSIWDTFSRTPGRTLGGDTGDVACDHYRRWESDLDLMAELGLRAYRFSVAWPRIQPTGTGATNGAGLDFYDRLVDGLLLRGIDPWITLYHWDLPQALEDRGGWLTPDTAQRFAEYAAVVAARLGDRVGHWITLNEPRTFAFIGYGSGRHAPGRRGWGTALRAAHHAHLAHGSATAAIRAAAPNALVGICHDVNYLVPADDGRDADADAAGRLDGAMHRWFLDPTFGRGYPSDLLDWYERLGLLDGLDLAAVADAPPIDFLALNYYRRERVAHAPVDDASAVGARVLDATGEVTASGWEVWPDGLRRGLQRVADEYQPAAIAVTENGAAFEDVIGPAGLIDDVERRRYLAGHVSSAAHARAAGVPLVGYFVWSLLDNFEWALGYSARFGIVHVDFATQRRTVKASGRWFQSLLAAAPR